MKPTLISILLLSMQTNPQQKHNPDTTVYTATEIAPSFPDREDAMVKFIIQRMKIPYKSGNEIPETRLFVSFVVEKDGSLSRFKIERGDLSMCTQLIDILKKAPKWIPAKQNGKVVRCYYAIPLQVELGDM